MFAYNALSQYVSSEPENGNFINSMDPEGNNIIDVEINDGGEDAFFDLKNSLLLEQGIQ